MSSELQPTALPSEPAVHHHHDPAHVKMLVDRLARIEGHVRGISTMVREDRPCPEVLVQISAVRAALTQVARLILKEHLSDCIVHAVNNGGGLAEIQALNQAIDRFLD